VDASPEPGAVLLSEEFAGASIDPRLTWLNPPQRWTSGRGSLRVETAAETDFWQRTHYGFRADSGHMLGAEIEGDFAASTELRFAPAHQYDQAGLMVRVSADCWLKTSVEWEPEGPARLGAVVTNGAWSDWSVQDFPRERRALALRVWRRGGDYVVEHASSASEGSWSLLRVARLHDDDGSRPLRCGLYACSPKGSGYVVEFDRLAIHALAPGGA